MKAYQRAEQVIKSCVLACSLPPLPAIAAPAYQRGIHHSLPGHISQCKSPELGRFVGQRNAEVAVHARVCGCVCVCTETCRAKGRGTPVMESPWCWCFLSNWVKCHRRFTRRLVSTFPDASVLPLNPFIATIWFAIIRLVVYDLGGLTINIFTASHHVCTRLRGTAGTH